MQVDVITLFPSMFKGFLGESIIKRAQDKGLLRVNLHNLRQFTHDRHKTVDDLPFGGGGGMVMKPEPLFSAVESIVRGVDSTPQIILLSPQGIPLNQEKVKELARKESLLLISGHYEGVDERVKEHLIDEEISIGDYVLTGGELAAMVLIDTVTRMLPGVLGSENSAREDSFYDGFLDYPQYTRPAMFRGWKVPEVLLSGNHQKIDYWRRRKKLEATFKKRPDLLTRAKLNQEEKDLLKRELNKGVI
ncbi:MAG: tRNA (guanosine(37)-N1)-methyltransferase TrmD [Candidatus Aerophobetes bacterium]|nr:tRNA (guanosine(37)-N1)-methyltransferase TrmD [Candidatus Aerophobetes bacterium]